MDARHLDSYARRLGLTPVFVQRWLNAAPDEVLWRVATVERGRCTLLSIGQDGSVVQAHAQPGDEPVAVGDWVLLAPRHEPARIGTVLERTSVLRRGSAHREGQAQLIAANLHSVFIVVAFSQSEKLERRSLRARRLDRFISAVTEGGATPIVVLNKADLSQRDPQVLSTVRRDLSARLGGVEVVTTSTLDGQGLDALAERIGTGETVAFIGPSGVGKSSLVNCLLGQQSQSVGDVRERDSKGRHTTTRRELVPLPGGGLLVDTPGVREFAVLADGNVAGFDDIEQLAMACKFSDCAHDKEPGCAVRAAVERGELAQDRVESFAAIDKDAARLRAKQDPYGRHLARAEERRFGRLVRTLIDHKRSS